MYMILLALDATLRGEEESKGIWDYKSGMGVVRWDGSSFIYTHEIGFWIAAFVSLFLSLLACGPCCGFGQCRWPGRRHVAGLNSSSDLSIAWLSVVRFVRHGMCRSFWEVVVF